MRQLGKKEEAFKYVWTQVEKVMSKDKGAEAPAGGFVQPLALDFSKSGDAQGEYL